MTDDRKLRHLHKYEVYEALLMLITLGKVMEHGLEQKNAVVEA